MLNGQLRGFLEEEIRRVKGTYFPVRAGFFRQAFTWKVSPRKLHPNPEDEFCDPRIGPSQEILSNYEHAYRHAYYEHFSNEYRTSGIAEPIYIMKAFPEGYMILNGHHRWVAALRMGIRRVKVKLVNQTRAEDVERMLKKAGSDRRVAMDLDEVVFAAPDSACVERPLRFPLTLVYRERLRLGIPALFHYLTKNKYDIWVYTAKPYSLDYLKYCFKHYRVHVTGIVTGVGKKVARITDEKAKMNRMIEAHYRQTMTIDNEMVVRTTGDSGAFEEYALNCAEADWSRRVMEIIDGVNRHG